MKIYQDLKDETCKGKGKALVKRITPTAIEKNTTESAKSDEEIYKTFLKRYVDSEEESEDSEEIFESSEGKIVSLFKTLIVIHFMSSFLK